ncbi:PQQ-binding-like beta-propeller repeat protein [soil metagenome]
MNALHNAFRLAVLGTLALTSTQAHAEEWSRFRGPNGSGVIEAKGLPSTFDTSTTAWSIEMGRGWSSPVLWNGKLFVTAETSENKRAVECLNVADGKVLWRYEVPYAAHKQHKFNDFASSTPFIDEQRVYVNWTNGDAVEALALDHTGKLLWRKEGLAPYVHEHGSGCSAVVVDGIMIVRVEHDGPENCVLGLDAATGAIKWRLPLVTSKNPYSTPVIHETSGGKEAIIADTSNGFMGIDVKTGKMNWQHNPGYTQRSVGSFALSDNILFATLGSGGGGKESAVLKLDGTNKPQELYKLIMGIPYVPTPLVVGENMYLLGDGGIMKCVKFKTGAELYSERLSGAAGNSTKYFSSPVHGDGKIYCCSQTGDVVVVKASDKFEVLAANKLDSPINATPALANGRVYIRTEKMLWALGSKSVPVP